MKNGGVNSDLAAKLNKKNEVIKKLKDTVESNREEINGYKKEISDLRKMLEELSQKVSSLTEEANKNKVSVSKLTFISERPIKKRKKVSQEDSTNSEEEMEAEEPPEATYADKLKKVPPITVQGADYWQELRKVIKENNINVDKAKLIGDDLKIFPTNPEDYRKITNILSENKKPYYTYLLKEDKKIYAVLKGLSKNEFIPLIKEDLLHRGLNDENVEIVQMKSRKDGKPLSFFQIKTTDPKIFNIQRLLDLVVTIEPKRKPLGPPQCYNCQRLGHTQSLCSMPPRCVKCAGNHPSKTCQLTKPEDPIKESNATCVNCENKGHPASYKGCPAYKKATYKPKIQQVDNNKGQSGKSKTTNNKEQEELIKSMLPAILQAVQKYLSENSSNNA